MPDGDVDVAREERAGDAAGDTDVAAATDDTEGAATDASGGRGPALSPQHYARLLEALSASVYVLDPDGNCTFANDEMCALTGYSRDELVGAGADLVADAETVADIEEELATRLGETTESFTITRRVAIDHAAGETVPCRAHMTALRDEDGTLLGTVGLLRDRSADERRQELLARIQATTRSLMQAPSRETVAEIVADDAVERLDFSAAVVRLYDPDERTLVPVARADESGERAADLADAGLEEGQAAAVFSSGEPAVYEDPGADGGRPAALPEGTAIYHPIGVHGTLGLFGPGVRGREDVDRQIAALLATNAAAACNRAKREREVRDAREHVATIVDRIEGLVEDTIEVLVGATTREDVEQGVCTRLAATEPYAGAWLARPDVRETTLEPTEVAGPGDLPVAETTIDLDGTDPAAVAHREASTQVIDDEALATAEEGWVAGASEAGVAAAVAIPLAHRAVSYGVLVVCADRADAFDERELVVLEALGRAVADAVNAIESGRILETDEVVELSIAVEGGTLLDSVAAATGASLSTAGTMSAGEGTLRLFLTATGAEAGDVEDALAGRDAVAEVSLVADLEAEALFDCALADSVVADLVDRGAVPKRVAAEGDVTRLTVEVPDERAARETFGFVESEYGTATLVGYREHERPVRTRQEFRASLAERFTGRQETALRTAYHGGFFDWPRGADGDELADSMDISRPTYHQHLRAAQRKTFEELFEADAELRE